MTRVDLCLSPFQIQWFPKIICCIHRYIILVTCVQHALQICYLAWIFMALPHIKGATTVLISGLVDLRIVENTVISIYIHAFLFGHDNYAVDLSWTFYI